MKKVWKNHRGQEVKACYVSKIDKEKELIVDKYVSKAIRINAELSKMKLNVYKECDALIEKMQSELELKVENKGNFTLTTYDKNFKIEISLQNRIEFDDTIGFAQSLIKEFFEEITQGADIAVIQLINSAFETSRGKLDVKKVLSLFKLEIKHPKWQKAMDVIKKSISTNDSKRYVRFWKRMVNGEYQSIELNFSAL